MEILVSVLPVIIIIAVWLYIMFRFRKYNKSNNFTVKQDEMISLLREIRDELKDLNKNNSDNKLQ